MQPAPRRFFSKDILVSALVIGLVAVLAYGPFLTRLGFYQEDLYNIWTGTAQGAKSFVTINAGERPLIGYQFLALYPLLGNHPLAWQVYGLLVRLATTLAFFWLVLTIWPGRRLQAFSATLLFAVYPGFLQQPQAHTYQTHLTSLLFAILSIGLTAQSTREKSLGKIVALNLAALVLMALTLGLMEWAIGLEAVRWVLVWYLLRREQALSRREALARIARLIVPYLLAGGVFLYWRLFIFQSTRSTSNTQHLLSVYGQNPAAIIPRVVLETGRDFLETTVLAWFAPFTKYLYYGSTSAVYLSLVIALAGGLIVWAAYRRLQASESAARGALPTAPSGPHASSDNREWVWIGALAVLFALLAPIAANRSVRFIDRFDRYTLTATIGVAIFITGLIFTFLRARAQVWAVIFFTGIALVTHFNNALFMSDFWAMQKQIWWQLSWRAPQLEKGTLLFAALPSGFSFAEGYEIWGPANLVYYPESPTPVITGEVLNRETMPEIFRARPRRSYDWWIPVDLDFRKPLILSLADRQSCLNVIDGRKYELAGTEDFQVQLVAAYSRIDLIQTGAAPATPPVEIFGREPEHGWCYFYQKAMLARQMGDWQAITVLGDEALKRNLEPNNPAEWMPFFESYVSQGREAEAQRLAVAIKSQPEARRLICQQLETRPPYSGAYNYGKVIELLCSR